MIESYHFGTMKLMGESHHNDLKIIDNQVIGNWWRREGHALHPEDIPEVFEAQVDTLVVGTGAYGNMTVTNEMTKAVAGRGIEIVAVPTGEAVSIFNRLHTEGRRVAGAFHLTC